MINSTGANEGFLLTFPHPVISAAEHAQASLSQTIEALTSTSVITSQSFLLCVNTDPPDQCLPEMTL